MPRQPLPQAGAPKKLAVCAEKCQLVPITLQAHFKDLSYVIVFTCAYMMTRYRSLKQMTHSLAYKFGNPSMLYCKQTVTWRLYLRGLAIIIRTSICKLWLASTMS